MANRAVFTFELVDRTAGGDGASAGGGAPAPVDTRTPQTRQQDAAATAMGGTANAPVALASAAVASRALDTAKRTQAIQAGAAIAPLAGRAIERLGAAAGFGEAARALANVAADALPATSTATSTADVKELVAAQRAPLTAGSALLRLGRPSVPVAAAAAARAVPAVGAAVAAAPAAAVAAGAVAAGVGLTVGAAAAIIRGTQTAARSLGADVSPDMALALARADAARTQADLAAGQRLGPRFAGVVESKEGLSREVVEFARNLAGFTAGDVTATVNIFRGLLDRVNQGVETLDTIRKWFPPSQIQSLAQFLQHVGAIRENTAKNVGTDVSTWWENQKHISPRGFEAGGRAEDVEFAPVQGLELP